MTPSRRGATLSVAAAPTASSAPGERGDGQRVEDADAVADTGDDRERRAEAGAGGDAQQVRVGQRVAEHALVAGARTGEEAADQEPEHDARRPDVPQDRPLRRRSGRSRRRRAAAGRPARGPWPGRGRSIGPLVMPTTAATAIDRDPAASQPAVRRRGIGDVEDVVVGRPGRRATDGPISTGPSVAGRHRDQPAAQLAGTSARAAARRWSGGSRRPAVPSARRCRRRARPRCRPGRPRGRRSPVGRRAWRRPGRSTWCRRGRSGPGRRRPGTRPTAAGTRRWRRRGRRRRRRSRGRRGRRSRR